MSVTDLISISVEDIALGCQSGCISRPPLDRTKPEGLLRSEEAGASSIEPIQAPS
jgi:hypothetical protein